MLSYRTCRILITGPSFAHSSEGFSLSDGSSSQISLLKMILPSSGILIIAMAGQETTAEDSFVYVIVSTTDGSCSSGTSQPTGY